MSVKTGPQDSRAPRSPPYAAVMPVSLHRLLVLVLLHVVPCTALLSCAGSARPGAGVDRAPLVLIEATAWGSRPEPIEEARRHRLMRLTLHHAGVEWKADDDPYDKIRRLQSWGQREKAWPDLPYHYLIAPDGRVFEGRPIEYAGETNTTYDTRGHALVQLWGNFDTQQPTAKQIEATVALLARLSLEHEIDPASLAGHCDVAETACPGKNLYRLLEDGSLLRAVQARVAAERRADRAR